MIAPTILLTHVAYLLGLAASVACLMLFSLEILDGLRSLWSAWDRVADRAVSATVAALQPLAWQRAERRRSTGLME